MIPENCGSPSTLSSILSDLVLEDLPIGLMVLDHSGIITTFNHTLQKLTGLKRDDLTGRWYKHLFPHGHNLNNNKLQLTLLTGVSYDNIAPEKILPIKPLNYVRVTTQAIRDQNNSERIIGAMALFKSENHLRELEQAVIQAEKLAILGQLAASAFHEVKNQLTVAGGFLQLLNGKSSTSQYIKIINDSFKHTANIVNDFLRLAKPGYSQRKPCNISELISNIVTLIQGEATKFNLEIEIETEQDLPDLMLDSEQIKQVLLNIIKNGLEAMANGGKLKIKASVDKIKNILNIHVIDSGTGMNEETRNSLFKPFYTTKKNGTGLGMYISQQIIANHGGEIAINSQLLMGTTVTIKLPLP